MIIIRERPDAELEEMAALRKNKSGLPVNLYLDDSRSYKRGGHAQRIKFQPDKEDHPITRTMIPMSIGDDPQVMGRGVKTSLSVADIEKIKSFVKANKDLLLALSDMKIDIQDFMARMTRV